MSLTPSTKAPARSTTNRPAPVQTYLRSARVLAFGYAAVAVGAVLLPLNFAWREPLWLATVALARVAWPPIDVRALPTGTERLVPGGSHPRPVTSRRTITFAGYRTTA